MNRVCDRNGRFLYRSNLSGETRSSSRYNILRHAGAIYALAEYEARFPTPRTRASIRRASGYLRRSILPLPGSPDLLAVWSLPEVEGTRNDPVAKLGGTGLGLVALLSAERVGADSAPLGILRRMGNFLIHMQDSTGRFNSIFRPDDVSDDTWESLYYPGEAALGLTMLYERDPDPRWATAAENALLFLARERARTGSYPPDHWDLIATERLLRTGRVEPSRVREINGHALGVCRAIIEARPEQDESRSCCGYLTEDRRIAPTATRIEGMLAAFTTIRSHDSSLADDVARHSRTGVLFLLDNQVHGGRLNGGFTRSPNTCPQTAEADKRYLEVRIDYVQHALCAMLVLDRVDTLLR